MLKLAASFSIGLCSAFLDALFGELQFGLRVSGTEHIIHTARKLLLGDPSLCVIAVDFRNAFNMADRKRIAKLLRQHEELKPLRNYWQLAYGSPARASR